MHIVFRLHMWIYGCVCWELGIWTTFSFFPYIMKLSWIQCIFIIRVWGSYGIKSNKSAISCVYTIHLDILQQMGFPGKKSGFLNHVWERRKNGGMKLSWDRIWVNLSWFMNYCRSPYNLYIMHLPCCDYWRWPIRFESLFNPLCG